MTRPQLEAESGKLTAADRCVDRAQLTKKENPPDEHCLCALAHSPTNPEG